ncbi:hypothetical protein [Streptomyces halobius]|uniref:DUF3040 family protein n=1 Tax=Streptomyces halobius TaxID=2879846 RepID=A0ABY4MI80_9ACTN|nr:hypothetical protein [Streptomyces halobius]UQA96947.1 hypothetical protein K9S39_38305 [Streptomyces halobius]
MFPDDEGQLRDLTERFRRDARCEGGMRLRGAGACPTVTGRARRPLVDRPGAAWLALAAAIGGLATGIALAHGLVIAGALMLAGLSGQHFARGTGTARGAADRSEE